MSQLTALSSLIRAAGLSPGHALAQVRRVGGWAVRVGGFGPPADLLELLAGLQRPGGVGGVDACRTWSNGRQTCLSPTAGV